MSAGQRSENGHSATVRSPGGAVGIAGLTDFDVDYLLLVQSMNVDSSFDQLDGACVFHGDIVALAQTSHFQSIWAHVLCVTVKLATAVKGDRFQMHRFCPSALVL